MANSASANFHALINLVAQEIMRDTNVPWSQRTQVVLDTRARLEAPGFTVDNDLLSTDALKGTSQSRAQARNAVPLADSLEHTTAGELVQLARRLAITFQRGAAGGATPDALGQLQAARDRVGSYAQNAAPALRHSERFDREIAKIQNFYNEAAMGDTNSVRSGLRSVSRARGAIGQFAAEAGLTPAQRRDMVESAMSSSAGLEVTGLQSMSQQMMQQAASARAQQDESKRDPTNALSGRFTRAMQSAEEYYGRVRDDGDDKALPLGMKALARGRRYGNQLLRGVGVPMSQRKGMLETMMGQFGGAAPQGLELLEGFQQAKQSQFEQEAADQKASKEQAAEQKRLTIEGNRQSVRDRRMGVKHDQGLREGQKMQSDEEKRIQAERDAIYAPLFDQAKSRDKADAAGRRMSRTAYSMDHAFNERRDAAGLKDRTAVTDNARDKTTDISTLVSLIKDPSMRFARGELRDMAAGKSERLLFELVELTREEKRLREKANELMKNPATHGEGQMYAAAADDANDAKKGIRGARRAAIGAQGGLAGMFGQMKNWLGGGGEGVSGAVGKGLGTLGLYGGIAAAVVGAGVAAAKAAYDMGQPARDEERTYRTLGAQTGVRGRVLESIYSGANRSYDSKLAGSGFGSMDIATMLNSTKAVGIQDQLGIARSMSGVAYNYGLSADEIGGVGGSLYKTNRSQNDTGLKSNLAIFAQTLEEGIRRGIGTSEMAEATKALIDGATASSGGSLGGSATARILAVQQNMNTSGGAALRGASGADIAGKLDASAKQGDASMYAMMNDRLAAESKRTGKSIGELLMGNSKDPETARQRYAINQVSKSNSMLGIQMAGSFGGVGYMSMYNSQLEKLAGNDPQKMMAILMGQGLDQSQAAQMLADQYNGGKGAGLGRLTNPGKPTSQSTRPGAHGPQGPTTNRLGNDALQMELNAQQINMKVSRAVFESTASVMVNAQKLILGGMDVVAGISSGVVKGMTEFFGGTVPKDGGRGVKPISWQGGSGSNEMQSGLWYGPGNQAVNASWIRDPRKGTSTSSGTTSAGGTTGGGSSSSSAGMGMGTIRSLPPVPGGGGAVGSTTWNDITKVARNSPAFRDPKFESALEQVANSTGISKTDLVASMGVESGLNPTLQNRNGSNMYGLFQLGSAALSDINKKNPMLLKQYGVRTPAQFGKLSASNQMAYFEAYIKMNQARGGKVQNFDDLYMAIHYPAARNKPNDYNIYSAGSDAYRQNAQTTKTDANGNKFSVWNPNGPDLDNSGSVTRGEMVKWARQRAAAWVQTSAGAAITASAGGTVKVEVALSGEIKNGQSITASVAGGPARPLRGASFTAAATRT